ncbi:MAG TPA: hypothetical protein VNA12_03280 [Mycobacteriales bacterium]|nr:hypothetical protein [Mycobacteriales bacterium]
MISTRHAGHLAVLGLASALLALGGPASAEPLPNSTAPACLRPSDGSGTNTPAPGQTADANEATYRTGQGSVKGGALSTNFQPIVPSCLGATYTFTMTSLDGTTLDWITTQAVPGGTTAVSPDGRSATVTFTGDGQTQAFSLTGTTGKFYDKRNICVGLSMTTSMAGASYVWSNAEGRACGGSAGSYYG